MAQEITYTDKLDQDPLLQIFLKRYYSGDEEYQFVMYRLVEEAKKNSEQWKRLERLRKTHQPTRKEILSILSLK